MQKTRLAIEALAGDQSGVSAGRRDTSIRFLRQSVEHELWVFDVERLNGREARIGGVAAHRVGSDDRAAGDKTMRVLLIFTPGGEDKFFAEAGEPAEAFEVPPPPTSPPDVERLVAIEARYGLEIRPPS